MSAREENNSDDTSTSRSSSTGNLAALAPPLSSRRSPPNVILFLDNNQDARSTRSAIQRHTAHHAAAQRREARLQSSREIVRPRNLEWQRRPGADTPQSSESDTTPPVVVTTSTTPEINEPPQQVSLAGGIEQGFSATRLGHHTPESMRDGTGPTVGNQEPPVSSPILRSIGDDEPCNRFLQAFRLALQAQSLPANDPRHWQAKEGSLNQVDQGLGILRQRLENENEGCSDRIIQAVLVLFVYASNFQTREEAASHRAALDKMINLRGGFSGFGNNAILEQQLQRYAAGEVGQILHTASGPGPPTS